MSFHTVVFQGTSAVGTDAALTPIESVFTVNGNQVLIPRDSYILGALAVGVDVQSVRLQVPHYQLYGNPHVARLTGGPTLTSPLSMDWYGFQPMAIPNTEPLGVLATTTGTGQKTTVAVWVGDKPQPPQNGRIFTLRGTAASTCTANAYTNIAVTWESTPPAGVYNVISHLVVSPNGVVSRLVVPGNFERPGVPTIPTVLSRTHDAFAYPWSVPGLTFKNYQLPNVEVFALAADVPSLVYLMYQPVSG